MFYSCYNVNSKLLALAYYCGKRVINSLRTCCYRQIIKDEMVEVGEAFSRCWHSVVLVSKYFKRLTIFMMISRRPSLRVCSRLDFQAHDKI